MFKCLNAILLICHSNTDLIYHATLILYDVVHSLSDQSVLIRDMQIWPSRGEKHCRTNIQTSTFTLRGAFSIFSGPGVHLFELWEETRSTRAPESPREPPPTGNRTQNLLAVRLQHYLLIYHFNLVHVELFVQPYAK